MRWNDDGCAHPRQTNPGGLEPPGLQPGQEAHH